MKIITKSCLFAATAVLIALSAKTAQAWPWSSPPPDSGASDVLPITPTKKTIPEGAFKFEGRNPIYYSNGQGRYCWYETWEDFTRMTNGQARTITGRLSGYSMTYDGICGGPTGSRPGPHPDPNF